MTFNGQAQHGIQATTHRKRRILIVDDDASVRRLLRHLLPSDYVVREAGSGEEALDLYRRWPSDLVLLDIRMPGLDGYEVCRRLKATSLPVPPQIIMVTGQSASSEQVTAFEAGADDYMVKPVDAGELVSRVDLHFRLRQSQENTVALQHEIDGHHTELRKAASERATQLEAVQDLAVFTLAKVAESRDNETGNHMTRLREYAQRIATELSRVGPHQYAIDERFLWELYRSTPLHDIGKVGIPDAILLKPGGSPPKSSR